MAIKKMCPRCRRVIDIDKSYCSTCEKKLKRETNKAYDTYSRDEVSKSIYNSTRWGRKRDEILSYYYYLDLYDYFINQVITAANTVHHIVPLKQDITLAYEDCNLFPLSDGNHNYIESLYKEDYESTKNILLELKMLWEVSKGPPYTAKSKIILGNRVSPDL